MGVIRNSGKAFWNMRKSTKTYRKEQIFSCVYYSLGHSNVFFSVLRQMKIRKPTSQQGKKTNKKFKQNQYISFEPTQVMHFIQEK